ncbi:MAG: 23S rRNA (uracil(1939)-C(5))-methyltransferase RlmD [Prochlorococcaceae cyanobacterium]|jgi:23S rRNA (uracil1939-C5)-methyltransferase
MASNPTAPPPSPAEVPSLRVGQTLRVRAHDLSLSGEGIARQDGVVLFVPGLLPGEEADVRIEHRSRRSIRARLLELHGVSPQRRRPPCILAERCGGCTLQHLEDEAQADWKQRQVREVLRRLGGIERDPRPILAAERPLGYRNKALIPLHRDQEGRLRAGYYRPGSHRIVNMNHCPVLDPRLDELIEPLKADLEATGWPADPDLGGAGGLRHLGLRIGSHSGEVLLLLVAGHGDLPGLEALAERWMERWPQVVGVALNLQPERSNRLLGQHTRTLRGRDSLEELFAGIRLRIGADTFFQVNTAQAERVVPLLQEAFAPLPPGGSSLVLDAYCGIGTYSLPLAAQGLQVLGLEQHPASVAQAQANAERNGLAERARFQVAAVGEVLEQHLSGAGALLVDPPRKGLEPAALAAILACPPPRLAYLSCDPATLARDLASLCGGSGPYEAEWIQPIDFFPQTSHVETLAVLQRRP